jgi:cell wall-associated NlpC family hydrolase
MASLPTSQSVVQSALSLLGAPYRFGGTTPQGGFDCSGFVAYVMAQHAVALPRTTAEQFGTGRPVPRDRMQPGDLIFFTTDGPGATHVGIVVDAGQAEFVHAPKGGASVRVERFDTDYWRRRWVGARRVF